MHFKQFMMLLKKLKMPFNNMLQNLLLLILLIGLPTIAFSQVQLIIPSPSCKDSTKAEKISAWEQFMTERPTNLVYVGYSVLYFVNQQCNLSSGEKLIKLFESYLQDHKHSTTLIRTFSDSIMQLVKMELSLLNNPQWNSNCDARVHSPVEGLLHSSYFAIDSYTATLLAVLATEVAVKEFTFKLEGLCEDRTKKDLIRSTLKNLTDFQNNFPEFREIVKHFNQNRAGSLPQILQSRQKLFQILFFR